MEKYTTQGCKNMALILSEYLRFRVSGFVKIISGIIQIIRELIFNVKDKLVHIMWGNTYNMVLNYT